VLPTVRDRHQKQATSQIFEVQKIGTRIQAARATSIVLFVFRIEELLDSNSGIEKKVERNRSSSTGVKEKLRSK
jgi:hypothetical protein